MGKRSRSADSSTSSDSSYSSDDDFYNADAVKCTNNHSCRNCNHYGTSWKLKSKPDRKYCRSCIRSRVERLEEKRREAERERKRQQKKAERREAERLERERQRKELEQRRRRAAELAYEDDRRSFADSCFKELYDRLKRGNRADKTVIETVKEFVYACHGETADAKNFVAELRCDARASDYSAAVAVWKSYVTGPDGMEFCSLLNKVLRDDGPDHLVMRPATRLTRALNAFCVTDGAEAHDWPERNRTYRGAVLPRPHQAFYRVGKKYRVPMFLATSFERRVAVDFMLRAADDADNDHEPVMWKVDLDKHQRCMHVNYLNTHEKEFLFAPYTAYRVAAAEWQEHPSCTKPHEITLEVAADNRDLDAWPEGLPLAPWA